MKVYDGELTFEVDSFETYQFRLELTTDDMRLIERLQPIVAENGLYEATMFHDCLIISEERDPTPQRTEFCILHVQESFIRVTGVLKHDCHTFSTGLISLDELEEE